MARSVEARLPNTFYLEVMALNDLQLLDLAERAAEGRRGEKGAQGVGIRSIEQNGNESFTITLTDGSSKEIRYPIPEPGPAGPAGQNGKDGSSSTVAGPKGIQGEQGRAGTNGRDGRDGSFIDSAMVNSTGELLVGLSDGQILNVGNVVGPAGLSGERGPAGLPGPSGRDGTSFLSGYKAPSDSEDGNDGDFWLDLSSPQFDLYGPKRGGAWGGRTTFLKQPPLQQNRPMQSLPIGGGAGGGGGGVTQPPFRIALPPAVETQIAEVNGETTEIAYKVTSGTDPSRWSAGKLNAASTTALIGEESFTIGAELTGVNGDLDVAWRIARNPTLDRLAVFATSPISALIEGRVYPFTDV